VEQVKKFAFDIGWVVVGSVITSLIAFLLGIVLARWLGAADLGLYRMVITVYGIATLAGTFGIPAALVKYTAEYEDDKDRLSQTITSGLISSAIFGVVTAILLYALSGTLASVFHASELTHLLRILAFVFPITSILQITMALLNGLREMKAYAFLVVLQSFLMILFVVAFVRLGFGVEGAVFGLILSVAGACIGGLYLSRKFLRLNPRSLIHNSRKLVYFGSQLFGANAVNVIANHADIMIIGYFLATADVGYYSIAISLSMFLTLIPSAIQTITYPATSRYWSQDNHQALRKMIDKSMKYSACILLPVGLGVGFFSTEIVTVTYGGGFVYAAPPLVVLLVARVIRGSTIIPIGGSFSAVGRPDIALKTTVLSAGANIGLNILLIPRMGMLGAAVATTVSLLLATAIWLILMPRILKVRPDYKWYIQAIGLACLAIILFSAGITLINPYIWGGIILVVYIALILRFLLPREDKAMIKSLAHSFVRRQQKWGTLKT